MASDLLIEIGTEEIPSGYLTKALRDFGMMMEKALNENRISAGGPLLTQGTPRRMALAGRTIADRQEDSVQETLGPPRHVAFDRDGRPTTAAVGFAKKLGVDVSELATVQTQKGEYLYLKRQIRGRSSMEILAEVIPKIIADLPWPKSMRWGSVGFSFVRPIHWVLAMFGGRIIPFEVAGLHSGNQTRGHRFLAPEPVEVRGIEDYFEALDRGFVKVDPLKREAMIREEISKAAESVAGRVREDPDLLETVTQLVEYPSAVCGGFDPAFLRLPEAVLITSMRTHQKYFALYRADGSLMPNFVAVNNTLARNPSVVRKGHERVLRARLSDASFFFDEDRRRPLLSRLEDLKRVIYQADLGTSYAKVQRVAALSTYLASIFLPDRVEDAALAANLAKCDLVTQMVSEFPDLQGVMGEAYARLEGYDHEIAGAIREHYLPNRAEGDLPKGALGAVVGLADRMDTIVGCFAVGLEPTGAADPFALRRHAIAILRITEDRGWDLSMPEFIAKAASRLGSDIQMDEGLASEKVEGFIRERYKQIFLRRGYEAELIDAVFSVNFDRISDVCLRVEALHRFVGESEEFKGLALTFKRVSNILKGQEAQHAAVPAVFTEAEEKALWDACETVDDELTSCLSRGDFYEALTLLVRLKQPVDELFDRVEILTKKSQLLRENRVGLLQKVARTFLLIADLSKFSI
jgi:glycyl-tRNA synthetase beta chain